MEIIFGALAKSVVNFQHEDNIPTLDFSTKVRARYIKYATILTKMHKLDVMVNIEDNIQNLLRHIQEERARVKWITRFANEASVNSAAPMKDTWYNFGGGEWAKCKARGGYSYNRLRGGYNEYDTNVCGNQAGGGDIIDEVCEEAKMSTYTSTDTKDMIVDRSSSLTRWFEEIEDDEPYVLYGMICARDH